MEMITEKNKSYTILGISIWKIFAYFIIYSVIGYIIETIFGIITMGVWQSRQSFLYGPFLGIYGIGAVLILIFSKPYKKNNFHLFIAGFLIGSVTEYTISLLTEILLHTKWWDYSGYILNINGRICLAYSIFWGLLTLFLVKIVNVKIDKLIEIIKSKVPIKFVKIILLIITIFIMLDCILTCIAQDAFVTRMIVENNIEVENQEKVAKKYDKIKENEILSYLIDTFWNDEKMIKTFPNIKIKDKYENNVYLAALLPDIQTYYFKFFEK